MNASLETVPDSERRGLIGTLPPRLRPYASLMRVDRPIGIWLLFWPCAWGVALAGVRGRWDLFLWLALGVAAFYALALAGWSAALWAVKPDWLALLALVPAALHLAGQALRTDPKDGEGALVLFRSNRWCGLLVFAAMLVVGLSRFD